MNNSTPFFKRPLAEVRTAVVAAFLIVALIGFADATFLTVEHFRGVIPPCTTGGCDVVLTSAYSTILGIPVSLMGAVFYFAIALAAFIYLEARHGSGTIAAHHNSILKWTLMATVFGFIMSLWFFYLQAFVLHSYCQYCLGSAATSTILFVMGVFTLRRYLKNENV